MEGCSGPLGRSLCQDREGPVSSLWSDGWSNGAKLWSKPNLLRVSWVKFSKEPSCSAKQPGLVAAAQLCGSQLLPATVLDRWTAIALLSALSVPQLFFFSKLCGTVELNTTHGWRFLKNMLSLSLPGRSLSGCLSFPPPLFPLAHRALAKSWPLHWGNFFPGSPKAILPRFPLDLYPLPMFQIIYRRIYLLYVLADSFGNPAKEPPYSFIDCICYIWFIFVCHTLSALGFPSQSRRGGGASWRCFRKKKKTSMMQLCCHLRVTNTQWQTIRKGGESSMVSLTNCYDLWVPLASRVHSTCDVYLRSVAVWTCDFHLEG